ncbi:MAG TPA: penicillin-binding transpeptidase domain-containing protein [Baekduia sp.]|nr:penicillin-binding transpeptidase domain-containing protein [Baekduia sp.]
MAVFALIVANGLKTEPGSTTVRSYADAWAKGDTKLMYKQLSPESQAKYPYKTFSRLIRRARNIATVKAITIERVREVGESEWEIDTKIATRAFGSIVKPLRLPVSGSGENALIKWDRQFVFPGITAGAKLTRTTELPDRGDLLARGGEVLAQGDDRSSPIPEVAVEVRGSLAPIPQERRAYYYARGYPADAQVGATGLERILESRLAGTPGGTLKAGAQVIASSQPRRTAAVRTTVDVDVQRAAIAALAGRLGGVVAIRPRTGEIVAFSGIAFSGLQPPGSTFKIITLAAALQAKVAKPSDSFPEVASVQLSGVEFQNADQEVCGGTLTRAFAKSCNSVFGPLGAEVGGKRLVEMADRFGFDAKPDILGAATSVMPSEGQLGDDLAVGSAAIGQNTVQATSLQMALVAATIALDGRRPRLTLDNAAVNGRAPTTPVVSPKVAAEIERMMLATVRTGTGSNAAIDGVKVAGKTGTAELKETQIECDPDKPPVDDTATTTTTTNTTATTTTPSATENPEDRPCPKPTAKDTTAWFTAYAPAGNPEIAVAVVLPASGQGRDTAAPAAKTVIEAALARFGN